MSDCSVDYPDYVYDEKRDRGAVTWVQNYNGYHVLVAGWLDLTSPKNLDYFVDQCPSALSHTIEAPRAAFDSNGDLHIAYEAWEVPKTIRTTVFHPDTGQFDCNVATADQLVDYYSDPTDATGATNYCSTGCTGIPTLYGVSNGCLRQSADPDIAIDRTSSPNNIVVAFSTPGSSNCMGYDEGRWYLSTNGGASWNWQQVTGCQDNFRMQVNWDYTAGYGGVAGRFHTITTYTNVLNTNELSEIDWASTNGGQTWSGTDLNQYADYIAGPINTAVCYWGDYDVAMPDPAHSQFFYAWGVPTGAPEWGIEGATNGD